MAFFDSAEAVERAMSDPFVRSRVDVVLAGSEEARLAALRYVRDVRSYTAAGADRGSDVLRRACYAPVRVYGLFYRFLDIFERTFEALESNTDIDLDVFVAENASAESETNRRALREYVDSGRVAGYAHFGENILGSAFEYLYKDVFPPGPDDDVVVFSDLDMTIPEGASGWLREMLEKFRRFPEVAALSLDFDLSNWPRDLAKGHAPVRRDQWSRRYGIYRAASGIWFLAIRREIIDEYLDGQNVFGDNRIFQYIDRMFRGRVYGRLPVYCRHLSWDIRADADDYVETKYTTFYEKVYERHRCPDVEIHVASRSHGPEPILRADG